MKKLKEIINFWLVAIISTIVIIGFVVESLKINQLITYLEKQYYDSAKIIADNMQSTLMFESIEDFNSLTSTLDFNSDYISIEVWNAKGGLFARRGEIITQKLKKSTTVKLDYSYILTQTPIISSGKKFGRLIIKRSNRDLNKAIRNELLFSFITIIFISLFFIYAGSKLSKDVVLPINGLNASIKNILKSHDLNIKVSGEHRILETKELSNSFNQLTQNLLQSSGELEDLNLNLEELVHTKTEKLTNALEDMKKYQAKLVSQEKLASLGSLTAGIAHEIKNPLNLIQNSAQIITNFANDSEEFNTKLKKRNYNNEDIEYFIDDINDLKMASRIIMDNCKRADSIIKSMLSQSRSEKSVLSTKLLEAIVDQSVNLSYHAMRAKPNSINVELIKEYQENVVIKCYPDDLERALINIVDNSFFAMKKKKENKGQEDYHPKLNITLIKNERMTEIRIKDNGIGIKNELKEKVLEPFFTTKPTGLGTGLGMSMVNDVALSHHGELSIKSVENEFTEVIITLANDLS